MMEATQGALIRLETWSEYWCLPLIPSKREAFLLVDLHLNNLQPHLFFYQLPLRFNFISTFLGVTSDRTLSVTKHISLRRAKFLPRFKTLRCISASSWGSSKESLSLLYKAFLRPRFTYASPGWFSFPSVTKFERLHRAASRAGCLSSSSTPFLFSEAAPPTLQVILIYFVLLSYEGALRLQTTLPF